MTLDEVLGANPLRLLSQEFRAMWRKFEGAARAYAPADMADEIAGAAAIGHLRSVQAGLARPRPWVDECGLDTLVDAAPYLSGHRVWEEDERDETDWAGL